jgi:hypothetical protein
MAKNKTLEKDFYGGSQTSSSRYRCQYGDNRRTLTARVQFPAGKNFLFAATSRPVLGLAQLPKQWIPGYFLEGKVTKTRSSSFTSNRGWG